MQPLQVHKSLTELLHEHGSAAARVEWLGRMRLLPVHDLLYRRGLIDAPLNAACETFWDTCTRHMAEVEAEELRVASGFNGSAAHALFIKGAHLARAIYPSPAHRLRSDLDILVSPQDLDRARSVLEALGYRCRHAAAAKSSFSNQEQWSVQRGADAFAVDLHWKPRSHPLLADALAFAQLWQRSERLASLAGARVAGLGDELLLSVMHWIDLPVDQTPCLVWLLDQQLLWEAMDDQQRAQCVDAAVAAGIASVLGYGLSQAAVAFAGDGDSPAIQRLNQLGRREPARRLIGAPRTPLSRTWSRTRAAKGLTAKFRHAARTLFPPPEYMRRIYPRGSALGLPGLYVQRLFARLFPGR